MMNANSEVFCIFVEQLSLFSYFLFSAGFFFFLFFTSFHFVFPCFSLFLLKRQPSQYGGQCG